MLNNKSHIQTDNVSKGLPLLNWKQNTSKQYPLTSSFKNNKPCSSSHNHMIYPQINCPTNTHSNKFANIFGNSCDIQQQQNNWRKKYQYSLPLLKQCPDGRYKQFEYRQSVSYAVLNEIPYSLARSYREKDGNDLINSAKAIETAREKTAADEYPIANSYPDQYSLIQHSHVNFNNNTMQAKLLRKKMQVQVQQKTPFNAKNVQKSTYLTSQKYYNPEEIQSVSGSRPRSSLNGSEGVDLMKSRCSADWKTPEIMLIHGKVYEHVQFTDF